MAKKYEFDAVSVDVEEKSNEIEIIELWDNLPDYCKTPQTLAKIRAMASPSFMDKLTMQTQQEFLGDC